MIISNDVYHPPFRYLREADVNYPNARGTFRIDRTEYCEQLTHLTDVEATLCLNQLGYVLFAQGIAEGKIAGLEALTVDGFLELRKEGLFILKSNKRFHREISPREPFSSTLHIATTRKHGNLYLAKIAFSFEHGAAEGELLLALKSENACSRRMDDTRT